MGREGGRRESARCSNRGEQGRLRFRAAAQGEGTPRRHGCSSPTHTPAAFWSEVKCLHSVLCSVLGEKEMAFQITTAAGVVCALAVVSRFGGNVSDVIAVSCALGGDTDTIASMAGACSGGLARTPQDLQTLFCTQDVYSKLENGYCGRDWLLSSAEELAKLGSACTTSLTIVSAANASALDIGDRSAEDQIAELCGLFWSENFRPISTKNVQGPLDRVLANIERTHAQYASQLQLRVFAVLRQQTAQQEEEGGGGANSGVRLQRHWVKTTLLPMMHGPLWVMSGSIRADKGDTTKSENAKEEGEEAVVLMSLEMFTALTQLKK